METEFVTQAMAFMVTLLRLTYPRLLWSHHDGHRFLALPLLVNILLISMPVAAAGRRLLLLLLLLFSLPSTGAV